jgi:anthranilate synthase component 1
MPPNAYGIVSMTPEEFRSLARQGYTHIPVARQVLADLDTPLSTYLKLADGPLSYLFESVQGGEKWGRYSIIGLPCSRVVSVSGEEVSYRVDGREVERVSTADPLGWIESFRARFRIPEIEGMPRFTGGLVGYFSYDTVRYIEPRLARREPKAGLNTPDILLMVSERVVVFDNLTGRLHMIIYVDPTVGDAFDHAQRELDRLDARLREGVERGKTAPARFEVSENDFVPDVPRNRFEDAVLRAKRYIVEGDAMQIVLSQRLSVPYPASPLDLYRALRSLNPSPYLYYLNLGEFHIVGSSPEILVRLEGDRVTVRPIAGTRPRGATDTDDRRLEQELLADPKERAEHLMLIDLGRNDVGRVSETGSVQLTERMVIERYSHVMHIVSNVTGRLRAGLSAIDVLRATFPAGTVSGAPKVRAMEIIDELEPIRRGIYAGAVGYIGWNGNMDTAIAIRTAVIKDGRLYIQVGAGIVADSVPALEWEETMNKGRAMFRAVALVGAGLK